MIERQIESPIPMPLALVVKKALKSRSAFSEENGPYSDMPGCVGRDLLEAAGPVVPPSSEHLDGGIPEVDLDR
jgi:hypothetical protein